MIKLYFVNNLKFLKNLILVFFGKAKIVRTKKRNSPYHCNCCGQNNVLFEPIPIHYLQMALENQYIHGFNAETINYQNFSCSICGASDRDRLYALYFEKWLELNTKDKTYNILDIAPFKPFSLFLSRFKNLKIRTADLFQSGVDDCIDIQRMDIYEDEKFDMFICSHVLEHVEDDTKAMKELYRILKKGGWGIAMVPIALNLETDFEIDNITSDNERIKYFGQADHLRQYSKSGFISKLEKVGFNVKDLGVDFFGYENFLKLGILNRSVLYIVEKI